MIYRFFFALTYTAVCGFLTVASFAMGQIYEGRWKWNLDGDDDLDDIDEYGNVYDGMEFQINSAFQLGE